MFKRLLSYFVPINIHKQKSAVSKNIEITWNNGQLVLDSQNTNYSYGSLQRILRRGLQTIGFDVVKEMQHILVLGVAGGSVIQTLVGEVGFKGKISGVEIDPEIVAVANSYFHLDKIPNLKLYIDDAFEFVLKTTERYDLIIIDIFRDTEMPNFLFEKFFVDRIGFLLKPKGFFLFNTMTLNGVHDERNKQYIAEIDPVKYHVRAIPRVENHNELIVVQKLT
ncbi:MAG TPA: fused MFS/spermidine synthase [Flavobacterium sp.]|jgi:spermidine synthase